MPGNDWTPDAPQKLNWTLPQKSIEVFYNRKRQHSTLGYKSPMQFLENWIREQHQEKLVA